MSDEADFYRSDNSIKPPPKNGRPTRLKRGPMTKAEIDRRYWQKKKRSNPDPKTERKKAVRAAREVALAGVIEAARLALGADRQLYGVIYADPPWKFEPRSRITGLDRDASNHYPVASTDEIIALKPPAADHAVCFLWATAPMLLDALRVLDAWGFDYKSQAVWIKDEISTGYWFRGQHEILLVGTRGRIPAPAMGTQASSVITAPVREHSAKPPVLYDLIDRLYPTIPKLEMFARVARPGWSAWGAEAPMMEEAA